MEISSDYPSGEHIWPSDPPPDCPFEPSRTIGGLALTGKHVSYTRADTWLLSWASDDRMYSPYMDGSVQDRDGQWIGHDLSGVAVVTGADPEHLEVLPVQVSAEPGAKPFVFLGRPVSGDLAHRGLAPIVVDNNLYTGIYATATLVHDGVWYMGAELRDASVATGPEGGIYNWPFSGPFWGFRISTDGGTTWADPTHKTVGRGPFHAYEQSLFPEPPYYHGPVRFISPHFIDLGKNMQHSPDGKAYLVSHGVGAASAARFGGMAWNMGDRAYLARVVPSPATINRRDAYEHFAGHDPEGQPIWTTDFEGGVPLFRWEGHVGGVYITYDAPLRKYLACVGDGWWPGIGPSSTYLLEADNLTGPWRLVTYMKHFGPQAYFCNVPSRFISPDGRLLWLCYSANYYGWEQGGPPNPPGSTYAMCLAQARLIGVDG